MKNLLIILLLPLLFSCVKEDPGTPHPDPKLTYFYERTENNNLQVYMSDGQKETNLVNDNSYDYWWIKVSPDKKKFLCYRSPKGDGVNSYPTCELMVFNIDGTNGKVIVPLHTYGWEIQAHAKWSPDGKKIMAIAKCKDPDINDMVSRGRIVLVAFEAFWPADGCRSKHADFRGFCQLINFQSKKSKA